MESIVTDIFKNDTMHAYKFDCHDEAFSNTGLRRRAAFEICIPRFGYFGKQLRGETFDFNSQAMMMTNANEEHTLFHGERDHDECTVIQLDEALLEEADYAFWRKSTSEARGTGKPVSNRFRLPSLVVSPRIDYIHHRIKVASQSNSNVHSLLEIEGMLMDLIAHIYGQQYGASQFASETSSRVKRDNVEVIDRAKAMMLKNFAGDISLADISGAAFKSKFHFIRLFKAMTKQTPYQYLLNVRLAHAESLVLDTSSSITAISFDSGFPNYPHFIKTFTQHFGVSPLRYRSRRRTSINN